MSANTSDLTGAGMTKTVIRIDGPRGCNYCGQSGTIYPKCPACGTPGAAISSNEALAINLLSTSDWYQQGHMHAESLMNVLTNLSADNDRLRIEADAQSAELASLRERLSAAEKLVDAWRAVQNNTPVPCYQVYSFCAEALEESITAERAKEGEARK